MYGVGEPRIVAEVGGFVVAEDGPRILLIDRGNGPKPLLAFVLGILAVVAGGFGAVTLALGAAGSRGSAPPPTVAAAFVVVGLAFAVGCGWVVRGIRRSRAEPLATHRPVAIFDRAQRVYVDGAGVVVAPLDHVRFQRSVQLTSSSPKLVAVTPGGSRVLMRGSPFSGGIGDLDRVLTQVVHTAADGSAARG